MHRFLSLPRTVTSCWLALLPIAASIGCGGSVSPPDTVSTDAMADHGSPAMVCTSGQQIACACPEGQPPGVQVCMADGKGYGACGGCRSPDAGPGPDAAHGPDAGPGLDATTDTGRPPSDATKPDAQEPPPPDASGGGDSGDSGPGEPPDASGPVTTSSAPHNFAVHHLYVGDTAPTPSYTPSATAWASIGYDIDGKNTQASCTDCCTPYKAGTSAHQNGENGIDNSFGENIVSQLAAVGGNLSSSVSGRIASGAFTILLDTTGLTSAATQTNTGLGGQLFAGATYSGTPPLTGVYFSTTDDWPVSAASLANGMTLSGGATVGFPAAYVVGGVWVSGAPVTMPVTLSLGGTALPLTIHHAVVSFMHAANGSQGLATNGIISGALETTELIAAINQFGGNLQGGAECSVISTAFAPIVYDAQDLILDPTSGNVSNTAGAACNAISIGLAFDADEIEAPTTVAPSVDAGNLPPCPG